MSGWMMNRGETVNNENWEPPNRQVMYQRSDIATALEFVEKDMKMSMESQK